MLSPTQKPADRDLAYAFFRLYLGVNIAVHGASRIYSGVAAFAFAEALTGVFIFVGLWSRLAYCVGFLLIINLTFGSTLRQDWTAAGWQLLYAFAYAALLAFHEHNRYSVDGARRKSRHDDPSAKSW